MQAKHLFAGVAKRRMANVVQKRRAVDQAPIVGQLRGEPLQVLQGPASQVEDADRMGEAAGFSAMKGEKSRP